MAVRLRDGTQLGALKVKDLIARALEKIQAKAVITSYSIHYTKLYESEKM